MRALAAIAAILILSTLPAVPVSLYAGGYHAHTFTSGVPDNKNSTAEYFVAYTKNLNSSGIINGNVNHQLLSGGPEAILYLKGMNTLYVASSPDIITAFSGNYLNMTSSYTVGEFPAALAFVNSTDSIYVLPGYNNITSLNLSEGRTSNITIGGYPQELAYDQLLNIMFVTVQNPDKIVAVNVSSGKVMYDLNLTEGPFGALFDTQNGLLYYTVPSNGTVMSYNPGKRSFAGSISVGGSPYEFGMNTLTGTIYVSNQGYSSVDVINGNNNTLTGNISVGSSPSGISFDPKTGCLFVSNTDSGTVSVINAGENRVTQNITVGKQPYCVASGNNKGEVFIGNQGSGSISVLKPIKYYKLTFVESGLPAGTTWSVTANGNQRYSDTGSITFDTPAGIINYYSSPVGGYHGSKSGSATISGNSVVSIHYSSAAAENSEIMEISVVVLIEAGAAFFLLRGRVSRLFADLRGKRKGK